MNENNLSNPYLKDYGEDRKSWPPEGFLAVLLHELRNPIAVIRGWAEFLSDEETKEYFPQGIEIISHKIAIIEELHKGVEEYVSERSLNPDT